MVLSFLLQTTLTTLKDTEKFAQKLAACLKAGDCLALQGSLGAGKTTLARALLRALGVSEDVPSPTFSLAQHYDTNLGLAVHFDFYRIKDKRELEELGFDEALSDSLVLIEWPACAQSFLPKQTLWITMRMIGKTRHVTLQSADHTWENRLREAL
ncbi:MAG: tRNA (adenosine(37)-N6)-threonylcarbamoyltransferase complex ATPase subunit type 1 TsaE [Alphaproteobacteria bacterium]|nr:tRNA (adenosine(37)-N6)-threonylcarbamoyltransferase complex ATPase subunit type 1 TsaE [Alphaproteobacteria bacterium]